MVQISSISATGSVSEVKSSFIRSQISLNVSATQVAQGDRLSLKGYGFSLGSGNITKDDGSPIGTYTSTLFEEFKEVGQVNLDSNPITYTWNIVIEFTNPFDEVTFSINGPLSIQYVSPTNKEWALKVYLKHEENTLKEEDLTIPKLVIPPYDKHPGSITTFYTFKDGQLSRESMVFYVESGEEGFPANTVLKVPYGTSPNFALKNLGSLNEKGVTVAEEKRNENTKVSSGGVYQKTKTPNIGYNIKEITDKHFIVEILTEVPPKNEISIPFTTEHFTTPDIKGIWDVGGTTAQNVAVSTTTKPGGQPVEEEVRYVRYVTKQGASGEGAYKPPKGKLTVRHYITGTVQSLFPDEVSEKNVGESYTTSPKTKEGYTLGNVVGVTKGSYTREPIIVTYYYDKILTPAPADPEPVDPDVTKKVNVIQSANNGTDTWGNGDCVMCNCEDAVHTKTTITTTTTVAELVQKQSIKFDPVVKEEIKTKGNFNLIYIMDGTGSRTEMVNASMPTIKQWAESVKNSGINYYFESYGHDVQLGPIFKAVNKFTIPGNPTGIYQGTQGDRLGSDKRFGQLIDYMEKNFPGLPILFVYEGDFLDYGRPTGSSLAFAGGDLANPKATYDTLVKKKINFLGISDTAKNRTMQKLKENVYEISTGTVSDILSRDFILKEFAKEVVVQKASTGKTSIQVSDPNQGVNIVNAYVTEPDGNNRVLQLTSGKLVAEFSPTQSGTHTLHFTYQGKPKFAGKVIATLNGKSTEYPYQPSVTTKTETVTERSDCQALKQMNMEKLRDFAIMYRDLQTCDLAEEGAKGFYNVWCMFNNVIDQLCYLTEMAEKQGFKREAPSSGSYRH